VLGRVVGFSLVRLSYAWADNPLESLDLGVWLVSAWLVRWDLGGECLFPVYGSQTLSEYKVMWEGEKPRHGCCRASQANYPRVPGFNPYSGIPIDLELVPLP
jgi:hypothetical protein